MTLLAFLLSACMSSYAAEELRTWHLKNGEEFEAAFVRVAGFDSERSKAYVVFTKENGKTRAFPLEDFSEEDQEYVKTIWPEEIELKKRLESIEIKDTGEYAPNPEIYKDETEVNVATTQHWRVLWGNTPPEEGSGKLFFDEDFREMNLKYLEEIWRFYRDEMGVSTPYLDSEEKYKINLYIFSTGLPKHQNGWAYGGKSLLLHPGAMLEGSSVIPHEFTHCLQYFSGGFRNSKYVGWFWECHGNWSSHQFIPNYPPALIVYANTAHYDLSSTRHNYGSWPFLQYLSEHPKFGPDFCYRIWQECRMGEKDNALENPFQVIMRLGGDMGVFDDPVRGFGDIIGEVAARNVTWDYVFQQTYQKVMKDSRGKPWFKHHRTVLEPIVDKPGWYQPPYVFAPRQYGYNIIELIPEEDSRTIEVELNGLVDKAEDSDWRATIVAVDDEGEARYSRMWNDGKCSLELEDDENRVYLVVAATPATYKPLHFRMGFRVKARYPYEVSFKGCVPNDRPQYPQPEPAVAGAPHPNGGGFVAETANVDAAAFVGKNAQVLDNAEVTGSARIEDYAVVKGNAKASGRAIISGEAFIQDNVEVSDFARMRDHARIYGRIKVSGNARVIEFAQVNGEGSVRDDVIIKGFADVGRPDISGNAIIAQDSEMNGRTTAKGLFYSFVGDNHVKEAQDHQHLYVHWNFDEPNEFLLKDAFAYNDGFMRGDPTFTEDGDRKVLAFNGKDQYVIVDKDLSDVRDMSMDMWVRWDGGEADQRIFDFGTDAANCMYLTPENASGKTAFVMRHDGEEQVVQGEGALPVGKWAHVILTLEGDTGTLYVDDVEVGSNASVTINPEDLRVRIRSNYLGRSQNEDSYFKGLFDDFHIYTNARRPKS